MKNLFFISFLILLSNCSSSYEVKKKLDIYDNLMSLTFNEYYKYLNEYIKNAKYPNINK